MSTDLFRARSVIVGLTNISSSRRRLRARTRRCRRGLGMGQLACWLISLETSTAGLSAGQSWAGPLGVVGTSPYVLYAGLRSRSCRRPKLLLGRDCSQLSISSSDVSTTDGRGPPGQSADFNKLTLCGLSTYFLEFIVVQLHRLPPSRLYSRKLLTDLSCLLAFLLCTLCTILIIIIII